MGPLLLVGPPMMMLLLREGVMMMTMTMMGWRETRRKGTGVLVWRAGSRRLCGAAGGRIGNGLGWRARMIFWGGGCRGWRGG